MTRTWIRVTTQNAVFMIIVQGDVDFAQVVDAAPIAKWTKGKSWGWVRNYYERRGATFEELPN